jgi:glyoxylase-like metal-dependent hydrolase (beta-lactamase superfamily II)
VPLPVPPDRLIEVHADRGLTIVNVGYRSTNFWVLSAGTSRLLVDLGWMGQFGALEAELKRKDIPLAEITHGFATHYHGDHAGAAQDLKNQGMRLIVTPEQVPHITTMKQWMKPADHYTEIRLDDNVVVPLAESRAFLRKLGFDGQLVHTPGHSDDSVSLLLDSGEVFTGDLTHPALITDAEAEVTTRSWRALKELGASVVYAGHGPVRPMPAL